MTTREVAAYLRIKERKIYELLGKGDIPSTRVTGKWLFPKNLIDLWLMRGTEGPATATTPPPPIVAGSQDPLLDWALRESGSDLAMFACGSVAGLERLADGRAMAAGLHLRESGGDGDGGDYNIHAIAKACGGQDLVAVNWAWRSQGLVVAPGNPLAIRGLADLAAKKSMRIAHRQAGAGSAVLFQQLLIEAGLSVDDLTLLPEPAKSETELGLAVLEGDADAGLAIEAAARQLRLGFVALTTERFDMAVSRRDYFEVPFQKLLDFTRTAKFRLRAEEFGGYDISGIGQVVWNAP
ncbi:MAG: helix-turn-helix transcriptional regulator [Rhodospirillales bacterium]|nr:helix-turn-helix transcriptional regulator [Rhodospirillales bacterium]